MLNGEVGFNGERMHFQHYFGLKYPNRSVKRFVLGMHTNAC